MFAHACRRCARSTGNSATQLKQSRPAFTVPAPRIPVASRAFTTTSSRESKIGTRPLLIPSNVKFKYTPPPPKKDGSRDQPTSKVTVVGPLGELSMDVPHYIRIDMNPALDGPTLSIKDATDKKQKSMWGMVRNYLQNHILGVCEGHSAILRFVGVGFRASVEDTATTKLPDYPGQKFVNLKVGYSHPVELGIPKGVTASTPQPTRLLLQGPEKEVVTQFAANIRKWRVPEPYKGKGIFVDEEKIKLKNKKIK